MGQYRKLLLIADPDMQITPAYRRAVEIARKTGAMLHICLVDYSTAIASLRFVNAGVMHSMTDQYMKIRENWLDKQAIALTHEDLQVETSAIWGKPTDQMIVAKTLDLQPDVVLKDIQPTIPVVRNILTPLDWQLLRLCPVPLMLVGPNAHLYPQRIIATVDPMEDEDMPHELNDRVMREALAIAIQCNAELHAVHAFSYLPMPPDDVGGTLSLDYPKMHQEMRSASLAAFNKLMDEYSVPAERRHFLEHSYVENALADFTRKDHTDLVVMGTVYRTSIDRLMFGSTAERMLHHLNCDVLTLKPEGFLINVQRWFNANVSQGSEYGRNAA